ncbi:MAG TPA: serine/threonine-protein kinase, partial [Isosphaeraceae bacterium]
MNAEGRCPGCGNALPDGSLQGLCSVCLLREGLAGGVPPSPSHEDTIPVAPAAPGVLETLAEAVGGMPRVLLRDIEPEGDTALVEEPNATRLPLPGDRPAKYRLFGEIARGGMGAVFKARDPDLGRELALKVLLEAHRDKPDLVRRFLEEAQIGGQLQHPGIVPVYDLGAFADRRPFFAMKLVRGRTLAALLAGRTGPAEDLPRFLGIFEQVCQTMAYAHARGVIHRDLKPLNVMVGAFGEVQVMDWGLAKVLVRDGAADEPAGPDEHETIIRTARGDSDADASVAGTVLGTPASMPPEQARGQIEQVDERADVFALGSILCEILTGRPAYTGRSLAELLGRAQRADLAEALARLDGSGADAELIGLARRCLAAAPEDRPRDARAVAAAVTAYLAGVQERLRAAELARVAAQGRARLTVAVAASVLVVALLGGGSWAWVRQQQAARVALTTREVNGALDEATVLWGRAKEAPIGDLLPWTEAVAAARRAAALLARGEGDSPTYGRVQAVLTGLTRERDVVVARARATERDRRLLERLAEIRSRTGDALDRTVAVADFAAAFREAGLDIDALSTAEAGARIAARPGVVELAAAVDEWIFWRRKLGDFAGAQHLVAIATVADPDPWRSRLRAALVKNDAEALRQLAASADPHGLPAESVMRLAYALDQRGDTADTQMAASLLRPVQRRHPDDFWVNCDLAFYLTRTRPPQYDE